MTKLMLSALLLCCSSCGCINAAKPVIIQGIAVNGTDSTMAEVKINGTVITTKLEPGQDCRFDIGPGGSVFYAAWTNPNMFKRAFAANVRANGTVSIDKYQQYGCIWIIGRGFYTPNAGESSRTKY